MKTIIEINGRQYDAKTGQLLRGPVGQPHTHAVAKPAVKVIDGVNKPKNTQFSAVQTQPVAPKSAPAPAHQPVRQQQSLDIKKPTLRRTQKAQTLLRSVVKKPQKTAPQIHSTSTISTSSVERSATGRGLLLKRIPDNRLSRAKLISKSAAISRFKPAGGSKNPTLQPNLGVTSAPKSQSGAPATAPTITKPKLGNQSTQHVFQHPIAHATNHTNPKHKKDGLVKRTIKRVNFNPRVAGSLAAICAVIVIGGFFAYQRIPAVAMRVAVSQAGFTGHMPSAPTGFAFKGPINVSKGSIAVKFVSNSDDRSFVVTQKPTDWSSEALLANHVLPSKNLAQTYHAKGLTVYVYRDGNATWVDKGVWYSLDGKGALSSDQVLSIAGSM